MPTVISLTAYALDELSDEAKEKAREWYREVALDYKWWDCTYELAKEAGAALGIKIKDIYFSGFASQGDGACFVGTYQYSPRWKFELDRVFGEQPPELLVAIGNRLMTHRVYDAGDPSPDGPGECEVVTITKSNHLYSHENTVSIDSASPQVCYALRDFMRWIYSKLGDEYGWLLSDEQVDESIRANEYLFTESGKRQVTL